VTPGLVIEPGAACGQEAAAAGAADSDPAMAVAARRPAMIASVTELEASLLAPCTPVDAASPAA
jgi:hypothetical protein